MTYNPRFKIRVPRFDQAEEKAKFLVDIFSLNSESKIMELGADFGEFALLLKSMAGCEVHAVDRRDPKVALDHYYEVDFLEERIPVQNMDYAFIIYPFLGEDWWKFERFLGNVRQTLKPGGEFLLDLSYFNSVPLGWSEEKKTDKGKYKLKTFNHKKSGSFVAHKTKIYADGYEYVYDNLWRVFGQEEFLGILNKANMALGAVYKNFTTEQYSGDWDLLPEKTRLCVVLKRLE